MNARTSRILIPVAAVVFVASLVGLGVSVTKLFFSSHPPAAVHIAAGGTTNAKSNRLNNHVNPEQIAANRSMPGAASLLPEVRALRAATRARARAGYGAALESINQLAGHKSRRQLVHRLVRFWFSGKNCLWKEYTVGKPRRLVAGTLLWHGILVRFFPGQGGAHPRGVFTKRSPGVRVDLIGHSAVESLITGQPVAWTYRSITAISPLDMDQHDWRFFPQAQHWHPPIPGAPVPATTVNRRAAVVTVRFRWPSDRKFGVLGLSRSAAFDLSEGGMVTHWVFRGRWEAAGNGAEITSHESIDTTWREQNGCWMPASRTITDISRTTHGAGRWITTEDSRTRIRFENISTGQVKTKLISVAALGIPVGIFVADSVHREQYYYAQADAARIVGPRQPAGASAGGAVRRQ